MSAEQLEFHRDESGHRYAALLGGKEVGFAEVDPIGKDALLIKHTEIGKEFEGRGFAGAMVRHILEDAKAQGRGVIPICPYTAAFIKKHLEYMEYVRPSYRSVLGGQPDPAPKTSATSVTPHPSPADPEHQDWLIDEGDDESFPASDPSSATQPKPRK